jgi:hypothetical protein
VDNAGNHLGAGAVMIFRLSNSNLSGHLLHGIATLLLATVTVALSIDSANIGISAETRSVPNIVFILADDKYYLSGQETRKPHEMCGQFAYFRLSADY